MIVVHSAPGVGPRVHRHPYAEVFVVESGEATFRLGDETLVVGGGHVVVSRSGVPHGFVNSGDGELRLVAIHGASRFATEWLEGVDPAWATRPPVEGSEPGPSRPPRRGASPSVARGGPWRGRGRRGVHRRSA